MGSGIGELLGAIRSWRRQVGRAEELGVVLPDGFVLPPPVPKRLQQCL